MLALAFLALAGAQSARAATPFTSRDVLATSNQSSWAPDGRSVAYVRDDQLSLANLDGSGERIIGPSFSGTWSPDGRRIAYDRGVFDLDTGVTFELTGYISDVDWSPDGREITYTRHNGQQYVLYASGWDGTNLRALATGVWSPVWSPDGREIAFFGVSAIRAIHPDGTGGRTIVAIPDSYAFALRWSPDGNRLAFLGWPNGTRIVGSDGGNLRTLGTPFWSRVVWSSTGRWLGVPGDWRVDLFDTEGAGQVPLAGASAAISWSPGGDVLAYSDDVSTFIRSPQAAPRRLVRGRAPDWSPDGNWISFLAPPVLRGRPFRHCLERLYVIRADGSAKRPIGVCELGGNWTNDRIVGTSGPDAIVGGPGADRLFGRGASDTVEGGFGADVIRVGDGARDEVDCGPGRDVVIADAIDSVASDCERVVRRT